jgi:hypothetical protein
MLVVVVNMAAQIRSVTKPNIAYARGDYENWTGKLLSSLYCPVRHTCISNVF